MAINSIINAEKYSEELDKVFEQKSVTGFFADNALTAKFVGAKTVIIPDIDFQGLVNYDRNKGYNVGNMTVSNVSHTMTMDRARSLQIDREDLDETGIANLAGKVLGEYVRTKVVPECDAYVLSKLANTAFDNKNVIEGYNGKPIATMLEMINEIQAKVGFDTELVVFANASLYARIQSSEEFTKVISTSEFKQGEINFEVKSFNGVPILPVVNERMMSNLLFTNENKGGFQTTLDTRDIYMIVCPKNAVHLVRKTESMRIFTPEQNLEADAYKFDYRIYYDAFIGKHSEDKIYAWISKNLKFLSEPGNDVIGGNAMYTFNVNTNLEGVTYKWYKCADIDGSKAELIAETDESTYDIYGYNYELGDHYFFVRAYSDELSYKQSKVVRVTIV